jgi:hypothetical protein
MPDFGGYGTFITDAKGILHDVSKHGFDAFRGALSDPMNVTDSSLSDSFTTTFSVFKKKMADKYGIDPESGLSLENIGDQLRQQLASTGGRLAAEAIAGYGLKWAADLEGPLGLLVSEGLAILSSEIAFAMTKGEEYLPGQWVFLDYGTKSRLINAIPKVVQFAQTFDVFSSQSLVDIPDELDYKTEARHGIGFVLQKESSGYEWSVFSFFSGKEERLHEDKIRPCPESFANKLDNDPDFSQVREVLFLKENDPTLSSYIPKSPGEIVIYSGSPYSIIAQSGDEWFISASDGTTIRCQEKDLMPGKTLTSQRWNSDKLHLSHDDDVFFSGEWVWIPAGDFIRQLTTSRKRRLKAVPDALSRMQPDNKILGLVKTIHGKELEVVRAYDGEVLNQMWEDVNPASTSVQGLLNKDKYCGNWRSRVLEGANPTQVTPGESRPMLSLGLGELPDEDLRTIETPDDRPFDPQHSGVVEGEEGVVGVERSEDIAVADQLEEALQTTGSRYDVHWSTEEDRLAESNRGGGGGGSGTMMLVLCVGILWAVYG